jgi:membrane-associated protease RseP (regulator of RpoE activity)
VQLPTFPQAAKGAWLGVFLEQGEDGEKGVKVTRVYPAGPAARAGIRTGDAIIQVDGNRVEDSADLISVIQQFEGGATANITVVRDEQEMKIPVLLGVRGDFMEMQPPRTFENNAYAETANGSGQHAQYRTGRMNPADGFDDIPPYAMQLEHDRRVAEQHERIESEIRQLREEIRQLREQLRK